MTATTRPTTFADRQELLASLHPNATRMAAMLTQLLSVEGMRISDHGRGKYTYDAFRRAQCAAIRSGFIVERLPAGPHGRKRNVITTRWSQPYRDGVLALLKWAGGADLGLAAVLSEHRDCDLTAELLDALARNPSLTVLLPPLPSLTQLPFAITNTTVDTRALWRSWAQTARAVIHAVTT